MDTESQSILDFLRNMPMTSFMVRRSPLSNKEAQTLYDIWSHGEKDEYGKHVLPDDTDSISVVSLTSKGYIRNSPSRYATRDNPISRFCEFTEKGKELIRKIILHKEKSAFDKSSSKIDFEAILASNKGHVKLASKKSQNMNWLERVVYGSYS